MLPPRRTDFTTGALFQAIDDIARSVYQGHLQRHFAHGMGRTRQAGITGADSHLYLVQQRFGQLPAVQGDKPEPAAPAHTGACTSGERTQGAIFAASGRNCSP